MTSTSRPSRMQTRTSHLHASQTLPSIRLGCSQPTGTAGKGRGNSCKSSPNSGMCPVRNGEQSREAVRQSRYRFAVTKGFFFSVLIFFCVRRNKGETEERLFNLRISQIRLTQERGGESTKSPTTGMEGAPSINGS